MDIPTHALTSFALARAFFPRRGWPIVVGMLVAGTIADVDQLSVFFGPAAYLAAHRAWTHSILATLIIAAIATAITFHLDKKKTIPLRTILAAAFAAAAAHIVLDLFQSAGETLLWPFRATRFAADYLPRIDPWILTLLLAGILLPNFSAWSVRKLWRRTQNTSWPKRCARRSRLDRCLHQRARRASWRCHRHPQCSFLSR